MKVRFNHCTGQRKHYVCQRKRRGRQDVNCRMQNLEQHMERLERLVQLMRAPSASETPRSLDTEQGQPKSESWTYTNEVLHTTPSQYGDLRMPGQSFDTLPSVMNGLSTEYIQNPPLAGNPQVGRLIHSSICGTFRCKHK
jgi:hypothetical protein